MVMPIVRRAYLIAAPLWAAALPLATYAATREHASAVVHAFALAIYATGSLVCHQKPERSFHLWAAQLPVCARCTGNYVGAAIAVALCAVQAFRPANDRAAALKGCSTEVAPRTWIVLAAVPTVATLLFEWMTGVTPPNTIRFASGLPAGAVVSWLVTSRVD